MSPAEFSIKNRLISTLVIIAALAGGWNAYNNMSRFEDPEFTIRTAQVIAEYPGATPEEVANEVTEPLETAIQQMQEVEEIRSLSSFGVTVLSVDIKYEFSESKADLAVIYAKLRNKVRDAERTLPPGVGTPRVNDDFGDVFGIYYLITGDGFSLREINDYAKEVQTELLAVSGVAKVSLLGTQRENIFVEISRERAAALGVSVAQVYADLDEQNAVTSAGTLKLGNRRLQIQPTGSLDTVAALENLVVSQSGNTVVYLKDVANISRGYIDPPRQLVRWNGKPAIGVGVSNVTGANVVKMGNAIDAALLNAESRRPIGMQINEYYHQGKVVDASVEDFALNVMLALIIVLVTLLLFMGLRAALVIGGVLLVTIAATLATMYQLDIPMHRISLGALIIALGMLVDNAIVVTEGILVGTRAGIAKLAIAKEIVRKTIWPLLGGTLVGIIAFAPIGLAPGSTAEYTGDLFWVVMISLFFSWVFAITTVPFLADLLFKKVTPPSGEPEAEGRFSRIYKKFLTGVIKGRWAIVVLMVGMFIASIWGMQFVKSGFFPASTTPEVVVDYWLPEGSDISQTSADMAVMREHLKDFEGIENIQTLVGAGALRYTLVYAPEGQNSAYGQLLIKLNNYDAIAPLIPKIQAYLSDNFTDAQTNVWQFQLGPGSGSKIEATFSGPDTKVLRQLANRANEIMVADGGAVSIKNDWRQTVPVIQPAYSEARGRRLGVSRQAFSEAIATNFSGRTVGVFREGDELIPIIARAPANERQDASSLASIQIPSATTGGTVPLMEVVNGFDSFTTWQNAQIRRVNRVWTINAQCDPVPGELSSELLNRLRPKIAAMQLPDGYVLTWGGEFGDSSEANENLASTLPMGFLAMVLVVVLLFNAIRQPLIIWLTVPLALIGVVPGLILTGTALEFMAILGLLSLSGLLIKNAIVLVDQMDLEIREGKARFDAVVDSATSRVRPVMMGSLTTVLGVIPLLGDAFFRSMAVVLVFGLSFATLLTLIVVPALYAIFFRIDSSESGKTAGTLTKVAKPPASRSPRGAATPRTEQHNAS